MKQLYLILCLSAACSFGYAYQNEPDGFQGHPWQSAFEEISGLVPEQSFGGWKSYQKKGDDMSFFGAQASRISYGFAEGRLSMGVVEIVSDNPALLDGVRTAMIAEYGPGTPVGEKDVMWPGGKTYIKLGYGGDGAEIFFMDNRKEKEREIKRKDFLTQLKEQWRMLLKENDPAVAQDKLSDWIRTDGKGIVSRHSFNVSGRGLELNMTGGGIYQLDPPIDQSSQPMDSERIYSVAELAQILDQSPDALNGKDVLLRAVVVDGVGGFGCDDYEVLADAEFAELYQNRYNGERSPEEQEQLKKISILRSHGLSSLGTALDFKGENILRGHFFDPGMKVCEEGVRRFVVTGRE